MPDEGMFADVRSELSGTMIDEIAANQRRRPVNLKLPRWEFRTQVGLTQSLSELGMPTAFTRAADFSSMSTDAELLITDVIHEVFISVDEEGTEVAAATAVAVAVESAPADPPLLLSVDRPFLFWIEDDPTGALLFLGQVTDPTT
ncbi:MAG: serpin family protein [Actinomycetia bacterium]|nr:serpin family protein [Actinomycetes bacterium]